MRPAGWLVLLFLAGHAFAAELPVERRIPGASASTSLDDLTNIVRAATACCSQSTAVAGALTRWMRENHPIYAGRLPSEASQFRGFLLASLAAFPPSDELYGYVKSELQFGGHPFVIAAAAVAARGFAEKSDDLLPLLERYLGSAYEDEWVDITTPRLSYPIAKPTRARREIIRTLVAFGSKAHRSLTLLEAIAKCPDCGTYAADDQMPRQATAAAALIREIAPPHCHHEDVAKVAVSHERRRISAASLRLLDQDGESLRFGDLRGRPFVLTFFYTQCTNESKCVMTVRRLRDLAAECAKDNLADRVGIYGMTYDPQFDAPSVLRKYGAMHGMKFSRTVRLLKSADPSDDALRKQLDLRVNYGAGTVSQHGIQLFVFDKDARLAATYDNELWSPAEVKTELTRLLRE